MCARVVRLGDMRCAARRCTHAHCSTHTQLAAGCRHASLSARLRPQDAAWPAFLPAWPPGAPGLSAWPWLSVNGRPGGAHAMLVIMHVAEEGAPVLRVQLQAGHYYYSRNCDLPGNRTTRRPACGLSDWVFLFRRGRRGAVVLPAHMACALAYVHRRALVRMAPARPPRLQENQCHT